MSGDSIKDRIKKIDQSIRNLKYRRRKLLDKYLDGGIAKDIYEEADLDLDKKIFKAKIITNLGDYFYNLFINLFLVSKEECT